jgi:hypothetical protein
VILALGGLYFFLVFFNLGGGFLVNFAGFILPGYYSLEALFSASKVDDTQWLTVRLPQSLHRTILISALLVLGRVRFPQCV